MKPIVLTALVLFCGSAVGQRVEKVIHLGDTWRLPSDPIAFAYDSRDKTVFIGGASSDSVLILDERTIQPLGWIDAGGPAPVLVYSRALGKIYFVRDGSISVYDAFSHTKLTSFASSFGPIEACLDSEDNKLYVVSSDSATVTVVDCSADTVVAVLTGLARGAWSRQSICYVPGWRRVYCCSGDDSSIVAIDCRVDTLLARIRTKANPAALCYNSTCDRVYVLCQGSWGPAGIDVASNAIVSSSECLSGPLCCNPHDNKLYGTDDYGDIAVYDCSTDTITATVPVGADMMIYSPTANKVYAARQFS